MTEELITFETAKLAKAKGFDIPCGHAFEWYVFNEKEYGPIELPIEEGLYKDAPEPVISTVKFTRNLFQAKQFARDKGLPPWMYGRPTQDLLERWLRETHDINVNVYYEDGEWYINVYSMQINECVFHTNEETHFESYEQAREIADQHALNLLPDINETPDET